VNGKPRVFDKGIIFLSLIFLVLLGSGLFFYFQVRTDQITAIVTRGKSFALHFMIRNDDALIFSEVFLYNPRTGKGAVVDVPGNVGTIIESLRRVDRIDTLFKLGNSQAYRSQVGRFVGLDVPFYILFSLEEVERFVDILGGIEVFIANSVEIDSKGKKVLLPSGNVLLDGRKVKSFLSFVDPDETDLDRIGRVQKFLQASLKKMGDEAPFLTNSEVVPFLRRSMKTNLDQRALLAFIREIVKLDVDRMVFQRVLGTVRSVDNQDLLFPHFEGRLLRQTVKQIYDSLASMENAREGELAITIEILNGTKTAGLARRTREIFQSFGFEVVSFGNSDNQNVDRTAIIDRKGNPEAAARVAQVIRCTNVLTEIENTDSGPPADFTLILGRDFDGRYCK
jgi:anionic cell wall polymer biosynthesis LytR-Cps2A-Psr (LCP) family protein